VGNRRLITVTTVGVVGLPWRATVASDGGIAVWGEADPLRWHVAADDRWHTPATSSTLRQRRVDGAPVVETRMRIPSGDAVQRVYAVADHGGMTVIEIENDSPLPIAVALEGRPVCSARPATAVPIEGIDLPAGTAVFPVGHRATLTVALAHTRSAPSTLPTLPSAEQVVRGWLAMTERAGRLVLPDAALVESVTSARCELLLCGAGEFDDDPAAFLIGVGDLVRLSTPADDVLPEVAAAVHALGRRDQPWDVVAALEGARRALVAANDRRAVRDLDRVRVRVAVAPPPAEPPPGVRVVPWVERTLAADGVLLPQGIPQGWARQQFEVHGIPAAPDTSVSYAVRWHGDRPAVLWETTGTPVTLRSPVAAPGWSSDAAEGETLWPRHEEAARV
jgi:hypothetical protein